MVQEWTGDRAEGRSPQLYTSPGPGSTVTRVSQIVHGYRLTNAAVAASLVTGQRQPINPHQEQMFCMKRNRFGKFAEVVLEGFKVDPHQCAYFNGCGNTWNWLRVVLSHNCCTGETGEYYHIAYITIDQKMDHWMPTAILLTPPCSYTSWHRYVANGIAPSS